MTKEKLRDSDTSIDYGVIVTSSFAVSSKNKGSRDTLSRPEFLNCKQIFYTYLYEDVEWIALPNCYLRFTTFLKLQNFEKINPKI